MELHDSTLCFRQPWGGRTYILSKYFSFQCYSEIIREALRDWQHKRRLRESELAALRTDIAAADQDIAKGRVSDFDGNKIIGKGQKILKPYYLYC